MDTTLEVGSESPGETLADGRGKSPGSRRTQFRAGPDARRGVRKPREPGSQRVPRLLKAMRRIMRQPELKDRTQEDRVCRELLKADPKGFASKWADLELAFAPQGAGNGEKPAPSPQQPDAAANGRHDATLKNGETSEASKLQRELHAPSEPAVRLLEEPQGPLVIDVSCPRCHGRARIGRSLFDTGAELRHDCGARIRVGRIAPGSAPGSCELHRMVWFTG